MCTIWCKSRGTCDSQHVPLALPTKRGNFPGPALRENVKAIVSSPTDKIHTLLARQDLNQRPCCRIVNDEASLRQRIVRNGHLWMQTSTAYVTWWNYGNGSRNCATCGFWFVQKFQGLWERFCYLLLHKVLAAGCRPGLPDP